MDLNRPCGALERDLIGRGYAHGMKITKPVDDVAREVAEILRESGKEGADALPVVASTSSAVITYTVLVGGELDEAAQGLVLGAMAASRELGLAESNARLAAAQSALEAVGPFGPAARELVREALIRLIGRGPL